VLIDGLSVDYTMEEKLLVFGSVSVSDVVSEGEGDDKDDDTNKHCDDGRKLAADDAHDIGCNDKMVNGGSTDGDGKGVNEGNLPVEGILLKKIPSFVML
jgi:hypothetical protein